MKFSSTVWPSKCARYTWSADIDGLGEGGSVGGEAALPASLTLAVTEYPSIRCRGARSQSLRAHCCWLAASRLSLLLGVSFVTLDRSIHSGLVVSGSGSVIAPSQHPLRSTDFSSFHVVRGAIHAALVCRAPSKSRARMLAMPAAMSLTHRRDDADRASVAHKKA